MSWTRTTSISILPTALTFGNKVFVSCRRVTVYTEPLDTWVLRLARVRPGDAGQYSCHVNRARVPLSLSVTLEVEGKVRSPGHL